MSNTTPSVVCLIENVLALEQRPHLLLPVMLGVVLPARLKEVIQNVAETVAVLIVV